ncbi:MAG: UDP-N-acetylglucosamine 2-epimerase (non-hydrolyzing) [Negativicutes bacterium]|nr:UDP-N-acetylglucosamine 2-epimerase (non-hydrolyzing) [Negativicutes bacterium]
MAKKRILTVFGTRPEAIKMAPLVIGLSRHPDIFQARLAVTAQHREMLDQVLELFGIAADYDLDIMSQGQTLQDITCRVLTGMAAVLDDFAPDLVLVHGDTSTTFVAALAAFYRQIPVGHVEAGLRTGNKYSPYPEEMNRRLTAALADLHFAPTATAAANLLREGIDGEKIFVTGNTVIDALQMVSQRPYQPTGLPDIDWRGQRVLLVTPHRRENLGGKLDQVYLALADICREFADVAVLFPIHKNPVVRQAAHAVLAGVERVHFCEPLDYQPFAWAMRHCYAVLTDSGGIQEEAPAMGKPVLVLRDTTERPEAVAAGTVKMTGTDRAAVYADCRRLLTDQHFYRRMAQAVNPYGDGRAAGRIIDTICWWAGCRATPGEIFSV